MSMIYMHVYVYDIHSVYIRNMNAITINKRGHEFESNQ